MAQSGCPWCYAWGSEDPGGEGCTGVEDVLLFHWTNESVASHKTICCGDIPLSSSPPKGDDAARPALAEVSGRLTREAIARGAPGPSSDLCKLLTVLRE